MGSGDIIAGSNPSIPEPKAKAMDVKSLAKGAAASRQRAEANSGERRCGAMAQQRSDSGATSTPQEFLHLIGCRDPKVRPPGGR